MKRFLIFFSGVIFFCFIIYYGIGFYIATSILKMDHTCGLHENSFPNTWSTKLDVYNNNYASHKLRQNFAYEKYYLDDWQNIYFPSLEKGIKLNGWLFNYFPKRPIVIIVHGLFPNGKCKPESNLIASMLISKEINAFTIDLRNYGQSDIVSEYEDLGLRSYKDVLGAINFLKEIGFDSNQIGLHGISLGASTVIFAAAENKNINAIWAESSLAEFNLILKDEIARYGLPSIFGPAVSFAGKTLTGIDPSELNPAKKLSLTQNYFFTHGEKDLRILPHHFTYLKNYSESNNIKSTFWLVPNTYHVDSMFKYTDEYADKMKTFFEKHLNK